MRRISWQRLSTGSVVVVADAGPRSDVRIRRGDEGPVTLIVGEQFLSCSDDLLNEFVQLVVGLSTFDVILRDDLLDDAGSGRVGGGTWPGSGVSADVGVGATVLVLGDRTGIIDGVSSSEGNLARRYSMISF